MFNPGWVGLAWDAVVAHLPMFRSDVEVLGVGGAEAVFDASSPEGYYMVRQMDVDEGDVLRDLLEMSGPSDVLWDVGANVGVYSCLFAQKFPGAKVVAFEPQPEVASLLRRNVELNGAENVSVMEVALSDRFGEGGMGSSGSELPVNTGATFLVDEGEGVDVFRGDDLLRCRRAPCPSVVKMDIEGLEVRALNGMRRILSNRQCRLVYVEVHLSRFDEFGEPEGSVRDLLTEAGFEVQNLGFLDAGRKTLRGVKFP